jgi:hypothetical protein
VFGNLGLDEESVMTTKPMKALVALASVALLGSLIAGVDSPAFASGCGLTVGVGTEVNPWRVSSEADFEKVGTTGCTLASPAVTYYRQSASFPINTATADVQVSETFAGVYDGDHHTLELTGDRSPFSRISGTVKKLRLTGSLVATYSGFNDQALGSLVARLDGGVISEVGSVVNIQVSGAGGGLFIGGLVGQSQGSADGLIQYSFFAGDLDIEPGDGGADIGGLVGRRGDLWIRDSYARANIAYGTSGSVNAGGIVGDSTSFVVRFIRTYAAGSFEEKSSCGACTLRTFGIGGLLGSSTDARNLTFVSAFWLEPVGVNAVGFFGNQGGGRDVQPSRYTSGLPVAVPVSAQTLSTLSTFQSREDATTSGQPSGLANLTVASSTGTLAEQDYRWAIESADVDTFVAQKRTASPSQNGETETFTRAFDRLLWTNSAVPTATYSTRGVSETVDGYPSLGRVWEICASENNGFPVLVWEDRNCQAEGPGGGGTSGGVSSSGTDQARAAGLSGAELTAFLASGLTLEQWLAQRLAATGTPGEALGLGLGIAGVLTMVGLSLLFLRRRSNVDPA